MSRLVSNATLPRSGHRWLVAAVAATFLAPTPAPAFFQQTKLEGSVGMDVGGVWLSVQQMMPEFRITFPKPKDGASLPLEVGPIPADLEPVAGKNAPGVVITGCGAGSFCSENGLLIGDILLKVGPTEITDVASYKTALGSLPPSVLLSVRRPALRNTTARLVKIKYAAKGDDNAAESSITQEKLDVRVLDVVLPFSDDLDKTRQSHQTFQPSPADLTALGRKWFELPLRDPQLIMNASHRFVAKDNFDEALANDKALTNARYAMIMDMDGNAARGSGGKTIDVYGIESLDSKTMEGSYVSVTIASAPFPINIEFKGRFRMTRIADYSDQDDKYQAEHSPHRKPAEDLSKYKTLPDVPPPAAPAKGK